MTMALTALGGLVSSKNLAEGFGVIKAVIPL
jgi:hypothetical protein